MGLVYNNNTENCSHEMFIAATWELGQTEVSYLSLIVWEI